MPWSSHRYDALIRLARTECRAIRRGTKQRAKAEARVERLTNSRDAARRYEQRQTKPRYCELCGGLLCTELSYEQGYCLHHGGDFDSEAYEQSLNELDGSP